MLKRITPFLQGAACQSVFVGTHLYAIGFFAKLFMPSANATASNELLGSIVIDAALLLGVALQHGFVGRRRINEWLGRRIVDTTGGNAYLFASSRALIALFAFWRPVEHVVWHVTDPAVAAALRALCIGGVLLALYSAIVINRSRPFGLRQSWLYMTWSAERPAGFSTPGPYRLTRHPMYGGVLVALWATPTMTVAHLLVSVVATAYLFVAVRLEERTLVATLGDAYRHYRGRVPMLVPSLRARRRWNEGSR
jgi:protein-S-isoprenylcysteine O-methyltransferase Ste14